MKFTAVILSAIILQTSASFFDDFRGAIISVETSFGKLLSDVASDVTDAIDCTIIAVEQVLSLDRFFNQGGSNDRRCRGTIQTANNPAPVTIIEETYQPDPPPVPQVTPEDIVQSATATRNDVTKALEEHIESSIAIANQTLFDIVQHRDTNQKLEDVKSVLKNETDRLSEVSALVRKELNSISTNVQNGLNKIVMDEPESSAEKILNDMKLLHEIELNNKSEAAEINNVFNEISDLLDDKEIDFTISHEIDDKQDNIASEIDKTRDDISLIEDQLAKWREESKFEQSSNNSDLVSASEQNGQERPGNLPKTFKEVAKKIMNKSDVSNKTSNKSRNSTPTDTPTIPVSVKPIESNSPAKVFESKPPSPAPLTSAQTATVPSPASTPDPSSPSPSLEESLIPPLSDDAIDNDTFFDYTSFFNIAPPSSEAHKEVVEHAKQVMETSKLSDMIMTSLLSRAENAASVFDSPDLFNFDQRK